MDKNLNQLTWMKEFLVSLNIAWIAVAYELGRPNSIIYRHGGWPIGRHYWHSISTEPYGAFDQLFWSLALAATIMLASHLLSRFWAVGDLFRAIPGIIVVAGFPIFVLYSWPLSLTYSNHLLEWQFPRLSVSAAIAEVFAAAFCVVLYVRRKPSLPRVPSMILLIVHFGLWSWLTGSWVSPIAEVRIYGFRGFGVGMLTSLLVHFGFPLLGFVSTVAWARWLNRVNEIPVS